MAKIKSTIDLVMERTKGLSLTREDREKLHRKEYTDKVRTWVQRYLDRKLNTREMRRELNAEADKFPEIRDILRKELVDHIQPEDDNTGIFNALEKVLDVNTGSYLELIQSYRTDMNNLMEEHLHRLRDELNEAGIHGSSVVPNITRSRSWMDQALKAQEELRNRLSAVTDT